MRDAECRVATHCEAFRHIRRIRKLFDLRVTRAHLEKGLVIVARSAELDCEPKRTAASSDRGALRIIVHVIIDRIDQRKVKAGGLLKPIGGEQWRRKMIVSVASEGNTPVTRMVKSVAADHVDARPIAIPDPIR